MTTTSLPRLEAFAVRRQRNGKKETLIPCGVLSILNDRPGALLLIDYLPRKFDGRIWLLPREPESGPAERPDPRSSEPRHGGRYAVLRQYATRQQDGALL